jgi:hypothetical protein
MKPLPNSLNPNPPGFKVITIMSHYYPTAMRGGGVLSLQPENLPTNIVNYTHDITIKSSLKITFLRENP